jgi:hypothetical protein
MSTVRADRAKKKNPAKSGAKSAHLVEATGSHRGHIKKHG